MLLAVLCQYNFTALAQRHIHKLGNMHTCHTGVHMYLWMEPALLWCCHQIHHLRPMARHELHIYTCIIGISVRYQEFRFYLWLMQSTL